ncbi:TPA: hypothetical protein MIT55_24975 [Klebsiella pneumoniae]|nr:hypothetical protein [Klebsiella pneumoniae]
MLSLSCIRLAIVTASDERSGSCVCEKVRAVGLIYQQSVEGDSRDPENKKTRSRREEIPRVKATAR